MFVQTYQECLASDRPYIVQYQVPVWCRACKKHGPCPAGHQLRAIDLTKYFKKIEAETPDKDFIPDILLTSGDNSLYVEIAVTHFLEEKKVGSGIRIVEIHITEENDIDLIKSCNLSEEDLRIRVINFRKTPVAANIAGQCTKTVDSFIVYPNGKCILCPIPVPEFERLSNKVVYVERVDRLGRQAPEEEFVKRLERAFSKGVSVRNCWICIFHCLRYQTFESFCRLKKQVVDNSNQAVACKRFAPMGNLPECGLLVNARRRVFESQLAFTNNQRKTKDKPGVNVPREDHPPGWQSTDTSEQPQTPSVLSLTSGIPRPPLVRTARCVFCGNVYAENSGRWWWFNAEKSECKCNNCEKKGLS